MQCDYKATLNRLISQLKNNQVSKKLRQMHGEWMHLTDIVGRYLYKAGVSANLVSIVGFAVGLLAINFLAMGMYLSALLCILINRAFDALDGAVARNREYSDFGVFLDATLDYTFYAGIIFGFALAYPAQNAVAASFLLFGFNASACAMLAYAVVAYRNNHSKKVDLEQSPFYLGGVAQGFETLTALVILCIVPGWFMPIAIILGCWCLVKALMVVTAAYYNFVIAAKGKN